MAWTDYSSAPAPGTVVCDAPQADGVLSLSVTTARGSFPMLVVRTEGGLHAYVNACPHQYLPLDWRSSQLVSADGTMLNVQHDAGERVQYGDAVRIALDPAPVATRPRD